MELTKSDFYNILENDSLLSVLDVKKLDALQDEFPYASNIYILKARALHDQQSELFLPALEKAASRTLSRKKLYELIEGRPTLSFEFQEVIVVQKIKEEIRKPNEEEDFGNSVLEKFDWVEDPKSTTDDIENQSIEKDDSSKNSTEEKEIETQNPEVPDSILSNTQKTESAKPELPKTKNDFTFSFIKVSSSKSNPRELPLTPSQVYDINSANSGKKSKTKKREDTIIEKFLESSPSISPPSIDFGQSKTTTDLAAESAKLKEEIITENMAMIYLKQKNFSKALDIYRKLKLKFPEKGDYFAALIKNLENKII